MTVQDGYTILADDLNDMNLSKLAGPLADLTTLPATYWLSLQWVNLVSSTTTARATRSIPIPDDSRIVEICITTGEHTGTVTVTLDNGALVAPISISGAVTAGGTGKLSRYYSDSTHPVQVLLKGSILDVVVTTTNTTVPSVVRVNIGLAADWRRA